MNTVLLVVAIILAVVGIVGSVVPGLPGPPLSWVALLLMFFRHGLNGAGEAMTLTFLLIWLAIVIVVSILDYIVPSYSTKLTGGSKYAGWGAMIGVFVGMFFTPLGVIACALIGAFVAELALGGKGTFASLKSSLGALLGFLFGTGLKLICSGLIFYYVIVYI